MTFQKEKAARTRNIKRYSYGGILQSKEKRYTVAIMVGRNEAELDPFPDMASTGKIFRLHRTIVSTNKETKNALETLNIFINDYITLKFKYKNIFNFIL